MIQPRSIVKIADNSGGMLGRVFKVLGASKKRYAGLGDIVVISIQKSKPRSVLAKKKAVLYGLVVRTKNAFRRKDGSYVRFDENAVILVDKEKQVPLAGRVFGPIPREIGDIGYQKIISLAPEVV